MPNEHGKPGIATRERLRALLAPDARKMMLDASVPEAIRRPMWWMQGACLLIIAAWLAIVGYQMILAHGNVAVGPLLAMGAAAWVVHLGSRLAVRRALSRAAAHDHLLCPECTYDLRTLDEAGTCPECGLAYEHEAIRAQWVEAQRRLKRQ